MTSTEAFIMCLGANMQQTVQKLKVGGKQAEEFLLQLRLKREKRNPSFVLLLEIRPSNTGTFIIDTTEFTEFLC